MLKFSSRLLLSASYRDLISPSAVQDKSQIIVNLLAAPGQEPWLSEMIKQTVENDGCLIVEPLNRTDTTRHHRISVTLTRKTLGVHSFTLRLCSSSRGEAKAETMATLSVSVR